MLQSPEVAISWEAVRTVFGALTTGGVMWVCRMVFCMRDDVRDLKHDVRGVDGTNGIKSTVRRLDERVSVIEDRHIALDAIARADREAYHGEERRLHIRRLHDLAIDDGTST